MRKKCTIWNMLRFLLLISVLHFEKCYLTPIEQKHLFQVINNEVPGNMHNDNNKRFLYTNYKIYNPTVNPNPGSRQNGAGVAADVSKEVTTSTILNNNIDKAEKNLLNGQRNSKNVDLNNFKKSETPLIDLNELYAGKQNAQFKSCLLNEHTLFKKYRVLKYIDEEETNMLFDHRAELNNVSMNAMDSNNCGYCAYINEHDVTSEKKHTKEVINQTLKCSPALTSSTRNMGNSPEERLVKDYCLLNCAGITKRDYIDKDSGVESFLSTSWNWAERFPTPIDMKSGRASVGILVDSHFKNKNFIKRFSYQLANIFSGDSIVKLAHFGSCLGMINSVNEIFTQPNKKIFNDFNKLLKESYVGQINLDNERNIDFSLATMLYEINDNAKQIDTPMKVIFLLVNGRQNNPSGYPHQIGEIAKRNNVKIYVIQFGNSYDLCHLTNITYPQRLFFLNSYKQVVLGGWVKYVYDNEKAIHLKNGLLYEIQRIMLEWSKNLRFVKGDLVKVSRAISAWDSDLVHAGIIPHTKEIETQKFKRNEVTNKVLSHRSNYEKFKSTQHWSRIIKQWNYNTIRTTNNLFLADSLKHPQYFMLQKLIYQITSLFPASKSKTTIRQLSQFRERYFANNKIFSVIEDIEKLTNEIPQYSGRGLITVPSILRATRETLKKRARRGKNVVFLILAHNVLDFAGYRDLSKAVKASRMKLYILGPGLTHQAAALGLLVPPSRLFLSPTFYTFFEPNLLRRLHNQLRRDFGAMRGINHLTVDRTPLRSRYRRRRWRPRYRRRRRQPKRRRRRQPKRRRRWRPRRRRARRGGRRRAEIAKILGKRKDIPRDFNTVWERENMDLRRTKRQAVLSLEPGRRRIQRRLGGLFGSSVGSNLSEDGNISSSVLRSAGGSMLGGRRLGTRGFVRGVIRRAGGSMLGGRRLGTRGFVRGVIRRAGGSMLGGRRLGTRGFVREVIRRAGIRGRGGRRIIRRRRRRGRPIRRRGGRRIRRRGRRRRRRFSRIGYAWRKFNYGYKDKIAKANTIVLLDRNMGIRAKRRVKIMLYGVLKSFTKYDNFISVMVYGRRIKVVSTFRMFNNDEDINSVLDKMIRVTRNKQKRRGKGSHLAEALFAAQDQFAYGMPGLPKVLMVFMADRSLDNYKLPTLALLKRGVRVMAFNVNSRVPKNQVLFLSGSKYLSFRMNPNHMIKSANRIIKILESVCGGVNKKYQIASTLSDRQIAKTWIWKNQRLFKLDFEFNPIEASFLIDTTTSPDYNIKLGYNIIRLFDPYTRMSLEVLGLSGKLSRQLRLMTLFRSESQKMFAFQALISNSVNKRIRRLRGRGRRGRGRRGRRRRARGRRARGKRRPRIVRRKARRSRRDFISSSPETNNMFSEAEPVYNDINKRSFRGFPYYRKQTPFSNSRGFRQPNTFFPIGSVGKSLANPIVPKTRNILSKMSPSRRLSNNAPSRSPSGRLSNNAPSRSPSGRLSNNAPSRSPSGRLSNNAPSRSPSRRLSNNAPSRSPSGRLWNNAPSRSPSRRLSNNAPSRSPSGRLWNNAPSRSPDFLKKGANRNSLPSARIKVKNVKPKKIVKNVVGKTIPYATSRKPTTRMMAVSESDDITDEEPRVRAPRRRLNARNPIYKRRKLTTPKVNVDYVDDASKAEIAGLINKMNKNARKYKATSTPKLRKRIRRLRYRARTLRNIIYYLKSRQYLLTKSRGHWPKVIFMIFSGYPIDRYYRNKKLNRRYYTRIRALHKISNQLKFQGIKVYTFLYSNRNMANRRYDRLFRRISMRYYKVRYGVISRHFKKIQTDLSSDFGYEIKYEYTIEPFRKYYSSTGDAIFRRYADIEAPPTNSFLSIFGMENVQNLKAYNRLDVITNSISYERITGFINVIVAVDISRKMNFHVVRQAASEIIALFHTKRVRTTLLTYNRYQYLQYRYRILPRGILAINRYNRRYVRTRRYVSPPNHRNLLRYVYRNILSNTYIRRRQTLLIVLSNKPSTTNPAYYTTLIKNLGVTIVTVGIGHDFNRQELANMASLDELSYGCSESIIQNCIIRIRESLIQLLNKPLVRMTRFERFSLKHVSANTKYSPMMTIRAGNNIRHMQKQVTRQHFRVRSQGLRRPLSRRRIIRRRRPAVRRRRPAARRRRPAVRRRRPAVRRRGRRRT